MPEVCYRKNYLTKVILRVEFDKLSNELLAKQAEYSSKVSANFPHVSAQPMFEMEFGMDSESTSFKRRNIGNQWTHLKSIDGTVQLILGQSFMSLEYGPADYVSFQSFFDEFNLAREALVEVFGIAQSNRIGLRYVNEIRMQGRALDWDGFINSRLLQAVHAGALPETRLVRSMHQYVLLKGQDQGILNYGIYNPDFPAPAVQRHFVLDIDCSRQGVIESNEISQCVNDLNTMCTDIFESSIDENLRLEMEIIQ